VIVAPDTVLRWERRPFREHKATLHGRTIRAPAHQRPRSQSPIDFFTVPTAGARPLPPRRARLRSTACRPLQRHRGSQRGLDAQQIVKAFPDDTAPSYLLRDHDTIDGHAFRHRVAGMRILVVLTTAHSPWPNPIAERLIGSVRREHLDHVLVLSERHLRRLLACRAHHLRTKTAHEKSPGNSDTLLAKDRLRGSCARAFQSSGEVRPHAVLELAGLPIPILPPEISAIQAGQHQPVDMRAARRPGLQRAGRAGLGLIPARPPSPPRQLRRRAKDRAAVIDPRGRAAVCDDSARRESDARDLAGEPSQGSTAPPPPAPVRRRRPASASVPGRCRTSSCPCPVPFTAPHRETSLDFGCARLYVTTLLTNSIGSQSSGSPCSRLP
jgi:hypothetical protein